MKILIILLVSSLSVVAQNSKLEWSLSSSPNIQGYKIYYFGSSPTNKPVGVATVSALTTNLLATNLAENVKHYFGVTAFSTSGESKMSNVEFADSPLGVKLKATLMVTTNLQTWFPYLEMGEFMLGKDLPIGLYKVSLVATNK